MKFCVVGAGFSGAILARHLSIKGHQVLLIDERKHIAGNCYTERDKTTDVMVHRYGPHIFHTADQRSWNYIQQFGSFHPYINRVKAVSNGRIYSLPINLFTINQFFGKMMSPTEAKNFIADLADKSFSNPSNFEEQALSMIGPQLYEAFFLGYTKKQWGLDPINLPASILKRLPVRFNYDDNYFSHPYQGMPEQGYTEIVSNIIKDGNVSLCLETSFESLSDKFDHVFYTGPIDRYFGFKLGHLGYRTLDFERIDAEGDYQGTAVINYCDETVPYTRVSEHKHFSPWETDNITKTVCFREYSRLARPNDTPYYPIRLANEKTLLEKYVSLARKTTGVSFLGRLGTYRYLDMDVTISEALQACDTIDDLISNGYAIPSFFIDPL